MAWWSVILGVANQGLKLVNKWVPSREEKAGRAMAERDTLKENADARERMDKVKPSSERDTGERLRDGDF